MRSNAIFLFLLGILIGVFLDILFHMESTEQRYPRHKHLLEREMKNKSLAMTMEDVKKIRLLCFLNSSPKTHASRAVHVHHLWGKHCDKLLFASSLMDVNIGAIGLNVTDDHDHMWGKEKLMLQYIHDNFLNDYDWFLKSDDDAFVIPENLRFLVSPYLPEDPIYFGYKFNYTGMKRGYFQGGSGYIMSRNTVRTFAEKVLTNGKFFEKTPQRPCHIETDNRVEDMEITVCLDLFNVYAGDGRDLLKRERFIMFPPEVHLLGGRYDWYMNRKYYWNYEGLDCCSNYMAGMHYISAQYQYTLYFLTYKLKLYGIKRHFPPPQRKYDFSKVAHILDEEIVNKALRGYK